MANLVRTVGLYGRSIRASRRRVILLQTLAVDRLMDAGYASLNVCIEIASVV